MFTIQLIYEYTIFQQVISFQVCTLYMLYIYSHSPWENRAFYRIPNKMINKRHLFGHIYESSTLPPAHEIHLPIRKRIRIQRVRAYKLVRICAIEAFWRILGGNGSKNGTGNGQGVRSTTRLDICILKCK